MKKLFLFLVVAVSLNSVAADLVGSWNVRNVGTINEDERIKSVKTFVFGVLGSTDVIHFKDDGTFFCNDTLYGKYSFKGDNLVIFRDAELVKKQKEKKDSSINLREAAMMYPDRFERDSFLVTFSKTGNRALLLSHFGITPTFIEVAFSIDKQGTNGAAEDLNEGASLIGKKYKMNFDEGTSIVFHFFPEDKYECVVSDASRKDEKRIGSYTLKGDKLTMFLGKEPWEGEIIFNQKGFILVTNIDGYYIPIQMSEVW
ncbi:MAG: hypothetical protein K6G31_04900 [Paludibacteraceae bacterium]|nr:hypothetical protein [Paludibacteraceae bacterium]